MSEDIRVGDTLIVGDGGDLGAVRDAPGPLIGARGASGLWLCLDTEKAWEPVALIDAINGLLDKSPAKAVRVVATRTLLADIAAADREDTVVRPGRDQRHVVTFRDPGGAPHQIHVDESIETAASENLVGGEIMQFVLPNFGNEMSLVEELAQAALAAGRADVACHAFVMAFATNPFFAQQPVYRDSFELVALAAGDASVPGIDRPARELFDELSNTARLPALPEVSGSAVIRMFAPAKMRRGDPDAYPSVIINPGGRVDAILIRLGGLLVQARHRNDVPPTPDVDFFAEAAKKSLQLSWEQMRKLERMKTERAAFMRFGTTLSSVGAVKPFLPEAMMLVETLRAGIPPSMALRALDKEIHDFENA